MGSTGKTVTMQREAGAEEDRLRNWIVKTVRGRRVDVVWLTEQGAIIHAPQADDGDLFILKGAGRDFFWWGTIFPVGVAQWESVQELVLGEWKELPKVAKKEQAA